MALTTQFTILELAKGKPSLDETVVGLAIKYVGRTEEEVSKLKGRMHAFLHVYEFQMTQGGVLVSPMPSDSVISIEPLEKGERIKQVSVRGNAHPGQTIFATPNEVSLWLKQTEGYTIHFDQQCISYNTHGNTLALWEPQNNPHLQKRS